MSAYLLDTNTCVEYLRSRNARVIHRIQGEPTQSIRLCSVVLGELYYGAFHSPDPLANLALLQQFVSKFASLPFDDVAAKAYGDQRAKLRKLGASIGPHDMQIAAIAFANGLTIVTHYLGEFSRVSGLAVEDWQV